MPFPFLQAGLMGLPIALRGIQGLFGRPRSRFEELIDQIMRQSFPIRAGQIRSEGLGLANLLGGQFGAAAPTGQLAQIGRDIGAMTQARLGEARLQSMLETAGLAQQLEAQQRAEQTGLLGSLTQYYGNLLPLIFPNLFPGMQQTGGGQFGPGF